MQKEDIMREIINEEINRIYEQYALAVISKKTALIRLDAFLDGKGLHDHTLIALATVKQWRR